MKPHGSEMYEIPCCAHLQLLPSMFTPDLAQTLTACPVGLSLLQLLPAAPLQTGAWLSYTTPGEMPLSCSISLCVPSGWRKMYSLLGYCCHRHLNSNHSSFLLYPQRMEWPHKWKHTCGQISRGETKFIITACEDQEVDSNYFTLKLRYKMNMGYFHAKMSNWKEVEAEKNFVSIQLTIQQSSTVTFRQGFSKVCCRRIMMALGISTYVHLQVTMVFFPFGNHDFVNVCQSASPVALNGRNHEANAQVTAAVLITNGRCLILFLKSHSLPCHKHSGTQRRTTKLYFAVSLNSFAVKLHAGNVYAQAVQLTKQTAHTVHGVCFKTNFQFTVEVLCCGCLSNIQYHSFSRH